MVLYWGGGGEARGGNNSRVFFRAERKDEPRVLSLLKENRGRDLHSCCASQHLPPQVRDQKGREKNDFASQATEPWENKAGNALLKYQYVPRCIAIHLDSVLPLGKFIEITFLALVSALRWTGTCKYTLLGCTQLCTQLPLQKLNIDAWLWLSL